MNIKLKQRLLKNGDFSLYLDYYMGYSTDEKGKIKHSRKKENLNLYLISKPENAFQRAENKRALELANKMLIKRQAEMNEDKFEVFYKKKSGINLINYFEKIKETKTSSRSLQKHWINTITHLKNFCNPETTTFNQVNEDFTEKFKIYLLNKAGIHNNTASGYFEVFREAIKKAYKEGILKDNPVKNITGIKKIEVQREFLELEEIQKLAATPCDNEKLKRAFLFACLTGLRWCDIYKLKWDEIVKNGNGYKLIFRQQKTQSIEYFPLSMQAVELIGEPGKPEEKVFAGLKYTTDAYYKLQKWGIQAAIGKQLTFHKARHTFATMQLTLGTDIYTVSKLLGHRFLKTTQIYAKIVDSKKLEAVNKMPEIKINLNDR